jgi:serine/threonine-protein kinase RsbW
MKMRADSGPPACEFQVSGLVLKVDELIESKIETISPVVDKLMRLLRESCCTPDQEFAVQMALREALANAIIHGNRSDPNKKVRICCACQRDRGILIIVKDEGQGFDPESIPSPIIAENIQAEHGRGIYLINLLMDEVQFRREGTEIHIRKRPAPAG